MKNPSTKDTEPDRKNLGPTGPAEIHKDSKLSYDKKHPNAGNAGNDKLVGPTPTDDPDDNANQLETQMDKKRGQTPPD